MKKILVILFLVLFSISGASFVFGNFINFEKKVSFIDTSSKSIIADSHLLNNVVVIFESNTDISNAQIQSSCNTTSSFLFSKEDKYYFNLSLLDNSCENQKFSLKQADQIFPQSQFSLSIEKEIDIFKLIIDYSDEHLAETHTSLKKEIQKLSKYSKVNEAQGNNYFSLIKKQKKYQELSYKENLLISILNRREQKYNLPVKGYQIATGLNVIPNAARNYRKEYTDGIHHGWDIMAPEGTPVSAIDDGIIIRVVKDFDYEDISKIKKGPHISKVDKIRNLDILRGNQVWLKTTKGDVIFYSHLNTIPDEIEENKKVTVGTELGTIGKTGVPDKNYTNFHLHFPIQKNPYNKEKAGKYSLEDYMTWEWYLKDLVADDVIKGQTDIFK